MTSQTAVVIGGSMTGLLAARVLSEFFTEVVVLERDTLPEGPEYRAGVPQARHLHVITARGEEVLVELFPALKNKLDQAGAPYAHWGISNAYYSPSGWVNNFETGLHVHTVGRATLEGLVRAEVMAIPNIRFVMDVDVEGLTQANGRINGVTYTPRRSKEAQAIKADFVVDASGRRSHAPEWLKTLGYAAPEEVIARAHTAYATRWYHVTPENRPDHICVIVQGRPAEQIYRGGGYMLVENNMLVLTAVGVNHDYPPTDEAAFMQYLKDMPIPDLYNAVAHLEPASPIYGYRNLESQMRHYERLTDQPEGFVAMGDAFCALNPAYGQGMSSAALQALALRGQLTASQGQIKAGFGKSLYKKLAHVVAGPWLVAVSEDMRYPAFEGIDKTWMTRLGHRYFDALLYAMTTDKVVAQRFFEVLQMTRESWTLVTPPILARVLWRSLRRQQPASMPASSAPQPAHG